MTVAVSPHSMFQKCQQSPSSIETVTTRGTGLRRKRPISRAHSTKHMVLGVSCVVAILKSCADGSKGWGFSNEQIAEQACWGDGGIPSWFHARRSRPATPLHERLGRN